MVHFIGAGPGAPDLITLRGARLLAEADVIIYAGSLVNPALLEGRKEGCAVYDSASMTLEEVLSVMEQAEREGKTTVRLHTGDPSLYGAIREQMDELDKMGVSYDVTPGVSSFSGAAAALNAEYTLPDVSQSVIITRMAGRTPVTRGRGFGQDGLPRLHHSALPVHRPAGGCGEGVDEGRLCPRHPGGHCVQGHLARPEGVPLHRVHPGPDRQGQPRHQDRPHHRGGFLGTEYERSKLYDPTFTHGCRKGTEG